MKPSEYLKNKYANEYEEHGHTSINVHCVIGSISVDEDELDKRFKDVEELKEKVIFLFRQLLNDRVVDDNNFYESNKIKIKVLELLEE